MGLRYLSQTESWQGKDDRWNDWALHALGGELGMVYGWIPHTGIFDHVKTLDGGFSASMHSSAVVVVCSE